MIMAAIRTVGFILLFAVSAFFGPALQAQPAEPPAYSSPQWSTVVAAGQSETFGSPDAACRRQHQVYNPNATYEAPVYRDYTTYGCRWLGRQNGGPVESGTVLPTTVEAVCPAGFSRTRSGECALSNSNAPEDSCPRSGPAPKVGNPICVMSGAKIENARDYTNAEERFGVDRNYRSRQHLAFRLSPTYLPGFGPNWHGIIPGRLAAFGVNAETIEYLTADGGADRFGLSGGTGASNWNFVATGNGRRTLSVTAVPPVTRSVFFMNEAAVANGPAEFILTEPNGSYVKFRRAGSWIAPDEIRYMVPIEQGFVDGYILFYDYPDTSEFPNKVRDIFGKEMSLTWAATPLRSQYNNGDGTIPTFYENPQITGVITQIDLPDTTKLVYTYADTSTETRAGREDLLTGVVRQTSTGTPIWSRSYLYENPALPYALTGILDEASNRLSTYEYHPSGLAKSTERAGGVEKYQLNYTYIADGLNTTTYRTVTNPLGREEKYEFFRRWYGAPTNMPSVLKKIEGIATATVPADLQTFTHQDTDAHRRVWMPASITDKRGMVTSFTNDGAKRRPTQIREAVGTPQARSTDVVWHPTLDLPSQLSTPGRQVSYTYSSTGQLLTETVKDTSTHSVPYSTGGQSRTTSYMWGTGGRLASVDGPRVPVGAGPDDVTNFAYDSVGNLTAMTNALGHVTSFAGYDANGRPGQMTDANGVITLYVYDLLGRVSSITVKHPSDSAQDATTSLTYDVEGRVTGITAPGTAPLAIDYDLAGRMTAVRAPDGERIDYTHDTMSNVTGQTVKRANGNATSTITRTFDSLGRMLTETLGPGRTTSWTYDKAGNPTRTTSPRSHATDMAFDPLNRLVTTNYPDTGVETLGYNNRDDLVSNVDAASVTTSFVVNGFGEVIRETSPDRGTSTYYYDAAGDMTAAIDGRGQRIDYSRDILGRITQIVPQGLGSEAISYTWDTQELAGSASIGRLSSITDASGTTRLGYDHRGNVSVKQQDGGSATTAELRYSYDLADRITRVTYPSGRIVDYDRDTKGRVVQVRTRAAVGAAEQVIATSLTYDPFGALTSAVYGNGLTLTNVWDKDRLTSRRLYRADGSDVSHLTYTHDANDNITGITDVVTPAASRSFGYDPVDRIAAHYGNLTGATGTPMVQENYAHDKNGNRTAVTRRAVADSPSPSETDSYTKAPGTNRLTSVTSAAGTRSFTHDARGNLTGETRPGGVSVSVGYDGHGRLISYNGGASGAQAMVYNGLDERVAITSTPAGGSATTRRMMYDTDHRIIGEYGGSATDVKAEYIWLLPQVGDAGAFGGDDGLGGYMPLAVAIGSGGGTTTLAWVHGNHMGTPIVTTDASGAPIMTAGYAAIGFPGQLAQHADVYYNRYRDYDPTVGRYIQADPIGLAGDANPYLYAGGNPLKYADPHGQWFFVAVAGAAFGGYMNYAWQRLGEGKSHACVNWGSVAGDAALGFFGEAAIVGLYRGYRVYRAGTIAAESKTVIWNNGWRTLDGKFASPLSAARPGGSAEIGVWNAIAAKPGWSVRTGNIGVRDASGQLRYYDGVVISPRNRIIGLEVKSGDASRTAAQRIFDQTLNSSSSNVATGVGQNAGNNVQRSILIRPGQ